MTWSITLHLIIDKLEPTGPFRKTTKSIGLVLKTGSIALVQNESQKCKRVKNKSVCLSFFLSFLRAIAKILYNTSFVLNNTRKFNSIKIHLKEFPRVFPEHIRT